MPGIRRLLARGLWLLLLLPVARSVRAQESAGAELSLEASALRVYLDCRCDQDYIRREIPFVTYVRLRQDAQIHLLVTEEMAGAGGRQYRLHFIGNRELAGRADTLTYDSKSTDTEELRRRGLVRTMKLGLLPYIAGTPQEEGIEVSYRQPTAGPATAGTAAAGHDPWNYWNFRAGLNGNLNEQATRRSYMLNGSFSANRTTEVWKATIGISGRKNFTEIELSDRTVTDANHNWEASTLVVRSVTPHLSLGVTAAVLSSVYSNYDLNLRFAPAIEYNLFPYRESSRRAFTLRYTAGVMRSDYTEETLFFKMAETLFNQSVDISYAIQQPWGAAELATEYGSYLHDLGFNNIQVNGNLGINLARGLSLDLGGSYERVRDQLSLPRGELSDDEVLLNRRQQSTGHRLRLNLGMSYRFGSIYNNVVNTRFAQRGPGMGGMGGGH